MKCTFPWPGRSRNRYESGILWGFEVIGWLNFSEISKLVQIVCTKFAAKCEVGNTVDGKISLGFQIKDMALKASGAYRHCKPCAGSSPSAASRRHHHHPYGAYADSEVASASDRFHYAYRRAGSSAASTPRLRSGGAMSSGDVTPSVSARTDFLAGDEDGEDGEEMAAGGSEEDDAKEWVAQVEPGVLITFLALPQGGNDLKRIRFR